MTQIEDLVRQALAETPAPTTSTDPLATLDRRVRRARRRLAAGAGVVTAVVAAAVAVPLAVLGGDGSPNSLEVARTPSPAPLPSGTTALWTDHAVSSATDSSGRRWVLYKDGDHNYVQPVGPGTNKLTSVQSPADYLLENGDTLWVVGTSRVTAIDTHSGTSATMELPQVSDAAVIQDSLYVLDSAVPQGAVARIDFTDTGMDETDFKPLPDAQGIVATSQGHMWVHAGDQLVELTPIPGGFTVGKGVQWGSGAILAPTVPRSAPDGVWAYDGSRLITLMPANLAGCLSCAEGYRIAVPGQPTNVVETPEGLFVAVPGTGLLFYAKDALSTGTTVTASLSGVQVASLTADPGHGVDYVDDQGRLIQWDPAGAGSR